MPNTNITVTPADGWVIAFTAAENKTIYVEKISGNSSASLSIDTATPTSGVGHSIDNFSLKNAALSAGENLYVRCADSLAPADVNIFVITG